MQIDEIERFHSLPLTLSLCLPARLCVHVPMPLLCVRVTNNCAYDKLLDGKTIQNYVRI